MGWTHDWIRHEVVVSGLFLVRPCERITYTESQNRKSGNCPIPGCSLQTSLQHLPEDTHLSSLSSNDILQVCEGRNHMLLIILLIFAYLTVSVAWIHS